MSKPVLMDFYAEWCGPCKRMGPIIEELKKRIGDLVDIQKVNVDENMDLAQKYHISVVPTLIIEKDGVIIQKYQGITDADTLENVLRPLVI